MRSLSGRASAARAAQGVAAVTPNGRHAASSRPTRRGPPRARSPSAGSRAQSPAPGRGSGSGGGPGRQAPAS
eukprot:11141375-Lingulodinium_polyedra.AAC.1